MQLDSTRQSAYIRNATLKSAQCRYWSDTYQPILSACAVNSFSNLFFSRQSNTGISIYKYDKISRICSGSLPKSNQLFCCP